MIGEGEKDEAPMLFNGEQVGNGEGPECDVAVDPMDLFDHVFAEPTSQLREQRAQLAAELRAEGAAR